MNQANPFIGGVKTLVKTSYYCLDFFSFQSNIAESDAGWSSSVARRAHNPKVTGSNPVPATSILKDLEDFLLSPFFIGFSLPNTIPNIQHRKTNTYFKSLQVQNSSNLVFFLTFQPTHNKKISQDPVPFR
jgi:hypothetical protein